MQNYCRSRVFLYEKHQPWGAKQLAELRAISFRTTGTSSAVVGHVLAGKNSPESSCYSRFCSTVIFFFLSSLSSQERECERNEPKHPVRIFSPSLTPLHLCISQRAGKRACSSQQNKTHSTFRQDTWKTCWFSQIYLPGLSIAFVFMQLWNEALRYETWRWLPPWNWGAVPVFTFSSVPALSSPSTPSLHLHITEVLQLQFLQFCWL